MHINQSYIEPSHRVVRFLRTAGFAAVGAAFWSISHGVLLLAAPLSQMETSEASPIWPSILAVLAAAFVLERGIEIVWNYLEWALLNFGGWTPARLRSPQFGQFKSGTSLLVAAVIGILIANTTSMRLFAQIEPLAPALLSSMSDTWDILVTGLLIGASTKPVHELMGILTHFSDYLANNAIKQRELAGAALGDGVLKLAESEAQSMIDVPGIGPTRIDMGGGTNSEAAGSGDSKSASPTDKYITVLHDRTSM